MNVVVGMCLAVFDLKRLNPFTISVEKKLLQLYFQSLLESRRDNCKQSIFNKTTFFRKVFAHIFFDRNVWGSTELKLSLEAVEPLYHDKPILNLQYLLPHYFRNCFHDCIEKWVSFHYRNIQDKIQNLYQEYNQVCIEFIHRRSWEQGIYQAFLDLDVVKFFEISFNWDIINECKHP